MPETDLRLLDICFRLHSFANSKYMIFKKLWTEFNHSFVWQSIIFSFWLLVHFILYGVLDATTKVSSMSCLIFATGYTCILFNTHLFNSQLLTFILMTLACFFQMEINLTSALTEMKHPQNMYSMAVGLLFVVM